MKRTILFLLFFFSFLFIFKNDSLAANNCPGTVASNRNSCTSCTDPGEYCQFVADYQGGGPACACSSLGIIPGATNLDTGSGQVGDPGSGQVGDPGSGQVGDPGSGQICDPNNAFGCISNPVGGGSLGPQGGLIKFLSNVLALIFTGAGIYAFIRIILAGLKFMSAGGDAKAIQQAWDSIWQSLLGVVIIISSLLIAALMGLLLFGNAGAILNPQVYGPTTQTQ